MPVTDYYSLVYESHTGVHGFLRLFSLGQGLVGGREKFLVPSRGAARGYQYPFGEQWRDQHPSLVEPLQRVRRRDIQLFRSERRYGDGRGRWSTDHARNGLLLIFIYMEKQIDNDVSVSFTRWMYPLDIHQGFVALYNIIKRINMCRYVS